MLRTWSGAIAPLSKDEGEVNIIDLTLHLGRTTRFGGYGNPEWSVLHHSILTALIAMRLELGQDVVVAALMHDFHEAYTGDIPSPVKRLLNTMAGKEITKQMERGIDGRIFDHLGLTTPDAATRKKVKQCDRVALVIESLFFGPTDCDLLKTIPEDDRAEMVSLSERVLPGFQAMVRRRQ